MIGTIEGSIQSGNPTTPEALSVTPKASVEFPTPQNGREQVAAQQSFNLFLIENELENLKDEKTE